MFLTQQFQPAALVRPPLAPSAYSALRAVELFRAPRPQEFQSINADVDGDGDEDQTAIRFQPIGNGTVIAPAATVEFELKPLKLFKGINLVMAQTLADACVFTSAFVGQTDLLTAKGALPLGGLVGRAPDSNLLDLPWAGPGLSIYLSVKNISAAEITFYAAIRGLAVVG